VAPPAPSAPFVSALSQSRLSVTWPELGGLNVDHFELFINGSAAPANVKSNSYVASGLAPNTTLTFQLLYQLADGRRSEKSEVGQGTTWGDDANNDGLPDDWQARYWGADPAKWPAPGIDSDGDGASNLKEFLAGTDPKDSVSVLRIDIVTTEQNTRLNWNTEPGLIYQVQSSPDLHAWSNYGASRFARGATDSLPVAGPESAIYYRVIRLW
jgi:hypothetical protein